MAQRDRETRALKPTDRRSKPGKRGRVYETARANNAFIEYCKLGSVPGEGRSVTKLAAKTGMPEPSLRRWYRDWDWEARAREYDDEVGRAIAEDLKAKRLQVARDHAVVASRVMSKMVRALDNIDDEKLTAKDIAVLLELAVKMQRQVYGEPTEIVAQQVSAPDGGPVTVTIADLISRAQTRLERVERRSGRSSDERDEQEVMQQEA